MLVCHESTTDVSAVLLVNTSRTLYTPRIAVVICLSEDEKREFVHAWAKDYDTAGFKRIDDWAQVPNSNVNNDGNPNLDNNDAENDNNARLAARCMKCLR